MNDLGINTITDAPLSVSRDMPGYEQPFVFELYRRAGWNEDMVRETVQHFLHTVKVLRSGEPVSIEPRSIYTDITEHGEARVAIYSKTPVLVRHGNALVSRKISVFNEYTDAPEAVDHIRRATAHDSELCAEFGLTMPHTTSNGTKPAPPQPQPKTRPQVAPDGSTDLDAWFPLPAPAETDSAPPPQPQAQHENGDPVIEEWSNMQRETYEQQYMGQVVRVAITKLQRVFWTNKDKTKSGECVEVYGVYNGGESNKTAYALRTFISDADTAWDWKRYRDHPVIGQLLQNPGDTCTARGYLRFKINTGKNGNVYWNLYGIELAEQPKEFDEQDTVPEGDIPF